MVDSYVPSFVLVSSQTDGGKQIHPDLNKPRSSLDK